MQKFLTTTLCILSILLVLLNIKSISKSVTNLLNHPNVSKLEAGNKYYRNLNYEFVSNTNNFEPLGKEDLLNIIYTMINKGAKTFTFYCSKVYKNCLNDINSISNDETLLTHLNNFVHPFNSFRNLKTYISDNGEVTFEINYLYSNEEIIKVEEEVKKIIPSLQEEADKLNENETDEKNIQYNLIKVIHDYIINNTKYDLNNTSDKSYNAYGALFNHLATCNGYTDLMAVFLSELGFNNYKIATTNGTDENAYGHVWNAVLIDDEWLHLDLTWDDPVSSDGKDYLYHKYFLITTEDLKTADSNITSEEHEFDESIYIELKD